MTTLRIENMHCGGCVNRVTKALNTIPGTRVESVQVGAARIETKAAPAVVLETLQKAGYPAHIE